MDKERGDNIRTRVIQGSESIDGDLLYSLHVDLVLICKVLVALGTNLIFTLALFGSFFHLFIQ